MFPQQRLNFATQVTHVHRFQQVVEVEVEGAYVRNDGNYSLQMTFAASDFVLFLQFKLVLGSKMLPGGNRITFEYFQVNFTHSCIQSVTY
jgi:hypothetical protein